MRALRKDAIPIESRMTWNEGESKDGPAVGWYWYREKRTSWPHLVKVFDVCHLKYVWPLGDDRAHPLTVRLDNAKGEFVGACMELEYIRLLEP